MLRIAASGMGFAGIAGLQCLWRLMHLEVRMR